MSQFTLLTPSPNDAVTATIFHPARSTGITTNASVIELLATKSSYSLLAGMAFIAIPS